jgi:hypothetical protein
MLDWRQNWLKSKMREKRKMKMKTILSTKKGYELLSLKRERVESLLQPMSSLLGLDSLFLILKNRFPSEKRIAEAFR